MFNISHLALQINLGVVPEHFSTPIYQAVTDNVFSNNNLNVSVVESPLGTGDMLAKLKTGELDVAIVVTEGFVSAKLKGDKDLFALGTYVESPLTWAASTGSQRSYNSLDDLPSHPTFGISRFGSGSEIMAHYLASTKRWDPKNLKFKVLGNLKGLSEGVVSGEADLFLWERFTTKHLYDSGMLRYIGEIVAPWPSFTIVTTSNSSSTKDLTHLMNILNTCVTKFVSSPEIAKRQVMKYFKYSRGDVESWWSGVRYPKRLHRLSLEKLKVAANTLKSNSTRYTDEMVREWGLPKIAEWDQ